MRPSSKRHRTRHRKGYETVGIETQGLQLPRLHTSRYRRRAVEPCGRLPSFAGEQVGSTTYLPWKRKLRKTSRRYPRATDPNRNRAKKDRYGGYRLSLRLRSMLVSWRIRILRPQLATDFGKKILRVCRIGTLI